MVNLLRLALTLLALLLPQIGSAEGNLTLSIILDEDSKASQSQPVVGEMIKIRIRAVYDRKVALEKLVISPSDAFDWIQTHQDDWHEEMIDGLPWLVMERRLAIWPRRAGPLKFGPADHQLTIIDKQSQRMEVTVHAPPLMISVGEFPELRGWHLAVPGIELTDTLSTDAAHLADGEVVTREVKLRVPGALPEHLPPRPVVSENWLITFAAPVERQMILTPDGPVAEVSWKWQFRPHTGEPGLLEPVPIPFYNTTTRKLDKVQIPALSIGYASFYTGQVPTGQIGRTQTALLGGGAALGLVLGLILAAIYLAPERSRRGWRRFRARFSPLAWVKVARAKRQGDLLTLRHLGEEAGWSPERLEKLDRQIYSRPEV